MNRLALLGFFVAALLAVGCAGDSRVCTLIGCVEALDVAISSDDWVPGDYVVEVTPEDPMQTPTRCAVTLPVDTQLTEGAQCTGPGSMYVGEVLGMEFLNSKTTPAQLTVTREGETLLDQRIDPVYDASYPNGPGCGACYSATETVTLP